VIVPVPQPTEFLLYGTGYAFWFDSCSNQQYAAEQLPSSVPGRNPTPLQNEPFKVQGPGFKASEPNPNLTLNFEP
jgi:hypothetical protein